MKYTLKSPVGDVSEIEIRKPKVKDLRDCPSAKNEFDMTFKMCTLLTGLAPSVLDELEMEDWTYLKNTIESFFPKGQ